MLFPFLNNATSYNYDYVMMSRKQSGTVSPQLIEVHSWLHTQLYTAFHIYKRDPPWSQAIDVQCTKGSVLFLHASASMVHWLSSISHYIAVAITTCITIMF